MCRVSWRVREDQILDHLEDCEMFRGVMERRKGLNRSHADLIWGPEMMHCRRMRAGGYGKIGNPRLWYLPFLRSAIARSSDRL